eukprot:scaffold6124_cov122-Cylindrotheca_fusiformis.AAC.10
MSNSRLSIQAMAREERSPNSGGLRISLDLGMAAVRRWIQSRQEHEVIAENENLFASNQGSHSEDESMVEFPSVHFAGPASTSNSSGAGSMDDTFAPLQPQNFRLQRFSATDMNGRDYDRVRQRSLSEPDAVRIRDWLFQRAVSGTQRRRHRRRRHPSSATSSSQQTWWHSTNSSASGDLTNSSTLSDSPRLTSASNSSFTYSAPRRLRPTEIASGSAELSVARSPSERIVADSSLPDESSIRPNGNDMETLGQTAPESDLRRRARERWVQINRRFQVIITVVALVFSLLLFAILVCWVVLTCAYVMTLEKACDIPLRAYYWLVTAQLVLDVFRTDIMRLFFRWDANSDQRIPCRVITYNFAYLTYALLVLRLGVDSIVWQEQSTCRDSAPELFQASAAFVYLSSAAWSTILFGYLIPFCSVAIILTWNGYSPSGDSQSQTHYTVFPTAMSAPPGCVDQLRVVQLEEFPPYYPVECCICMEDFTISEEIVVTECSHVFHKQCCRDWLRQARTCPVCRMDIPKALEQAEGQQRSDQQRQQPRRVHIRDASRNHLHHEVVSLLQIMRSRERRLHRRRNAATGTLGRTSRTTTRSASLNSICNTIEEGRER